MSKVIDFDKEFQKRDEFGMTAKQSKSLRMYARWKVKILSRAFAERRKAAEAWLEEPQSKVEPDGSEPTTDDLSQ